MDSQKAAALSENFRLQPFEVLHQLSAHLASAVEQGDFQKVKCLSSKISESSEKNFRHINRLFTHVENLERRALDAETNLVEAQEQCDELTKKCLALEKKAATEPDHHPKCVQIFEWMQGFKYFWDPTLSETEQIMQEHIVEGPHSSKCSSIGTPDRRAQPLSRLNISNIPKVKEPAFTPNGDVSITESPSTKSSTLHSSPDTPTNT